MKTLNVLMGKPDGLLQFLADFGFSLKHLDFCNGQLIEANLVETLFVFPYGSIAALLYILQHSRDRGIQLRSIAHRPLQQSIKLIF